MLTLQFEKLSRYNRPEEMVSVGIPFPAGQLQDITKVVVKDQERILPTQVRQTAVWPDGSCKWLLVNFLVDLPGNQSKTVELITNNDREPSLAAVVEIISTAAGLKINTGALQVQLGAVNSGSVLGAVTGNGFNFAAEELGGPVIRSGGREYQATIGDSGWRVVEAGPVRVVVEATGKHRAVDGSELLDFEIRLQAFAGKPWLQMDYRIINREDSKLVKLDSIAADFLPVTREGELRTAVATSNYATDIRIGGIEDKLNQIIDSDYLLYDMNEHFPETFYGTFFADWNDAGRGGVCLTQYQAYQNFPKAFQVDASGIKAEILPAASEGLVLYQGMAKTHTWFYHFHDSSEPLEQLDARSLQFQMPDRPQLSSEVYRQAEVFENVFVDRKVAKVEQSFIAMADSRIRAYGILAWGDAPDKGYTMQGRGHGELVWGNNEYDFPHAMMLMYAKNPSRRFFDYLSVNARHQMDVDVCHYHADSLRMGGQVIHSARHVSGYVAPCHQWVEGLLDYYHLTGDEHAFKTAIGIGENVMRILQQPRYQGEGGINARETGWAMRALVALYKETNEERWLVPAEKIVDHYELWKKQYGGWLAPYTDHTTIRVPFMIAIAVNSLMRYYRVRPETRIKQMILEAVEDMVENCILENGLFYYKELPSLQRLGNNPLVLEALTYAYEFTGDRRYLELGLPTFDININGVFKGSGAKQKELIEDAVISWTGDGNKRFAQSFFTLAYYYRAAVEAGVI